MQSGVGIPQGGSPSNTKFGLVEQLVGSQRSIAKQFNVSKATISSLLNGRSWVHVK